MFCFWGCSRAKVRILISWSNFQNYIFIPQRCNVSDCGEITVALSKSPWQGCHKAKLCRSNHRLLPAKVFIIRVSSLSFCHLKVDENVVSRHSHSWQTKSLWSLVMSLSSFECWCEKYLTAARCIITKLGSDMIRCLLRLRWLWLWDWHRLRAKEQPLWCAPHSEKWQTYIGHLLIGFELPKTRKNSVFLIGVDYFLSKFFGFSLSCHCFLLVIALFSRMWCAVYSVCYVSHIVSVSVLRVGSRDCLQSTHSLDKNQKPFLPRFSFVCHHSAPRHPASTFSQDPHVESKRIARAVRTAGDLGVYSIQY